jgi:hypothetical protein
MVMRLLSHGLFNLADKVLHFSGNLFRLAVGGQVGVAGKFAGLLPDRAFEFVKLACGLILCARFDHDFLLIADASRFRNYFCGGVVVVVVVDCVSEAGGVAVVVVVFSFVSVVWVVWVTGAGEVSVVVVVDCVASCVATGRVTASTASDMKAAEANFLDFV